MGKVFVVIGAVLALLGIGYLLMPGLLPSLPLVGQLQYAVGIALIIIGGLLLWKMR